jgi:hypothetical protein
MVGATLYTIISGAFVHEDAETIHEALIASATRRPRPVRELAPFLSPAVAQVIDRALELEMDDRWESADHMRAALIEARNTPAPAKYDSATALALSTSRRNLPLSPDDHTMRDSGPADVHSGELDLEPTLVPQPRHEQPRLPTTARMSNRPPREVRPGEFRAPMQTPSEEHETYSAPPRSVPPPASSRGSLAPRPPSLRPIHDPLEPTPIQPFEPYDQFRAQMPTIPPQGMPPPAPRGGQSQKETIALIALALFFLCAAMGAYMMRRPR